MHRVLLLAAALLLGELLGGLCVLLVKLHPLQGQRHAGLVAQKVDSVRILRENVCLSPDTWKRMLPLKQNHDRVPVLPRVASQLEVRSLELLDVVSHRGASRYSHDVGT